MRTKGAVSKKKVAPMSEVTGTPYIPEVEIPKIAELGGFGNEDTQRLVAKVNEIIRFINK